MSDQVEVNQELCIGCGTCESLCPAVFQLGDDEKSHVIRQPGEGDDCVQDAVDSCPAEAIAWLA